MSSLGSFTEAWRWVVYRTLRERLSSGVWERGYLQEHKHLQWLHHCPSFSSSIFQLLQTPQTWWVLRSPFPLCASSIGQLHVIEESHLCTCTLIPLALTLCILWLPFTWPSAIEQLWIACATMSHFILSIEDLYHIMQFWSQLMEDPRELILISSKGAGVHTGNRIKSRPHKNVYGDDNTNARLK